MHRVTKRIQQNPQLLFEFVITKLWQQGYKSSDGNYCYYRMKKASGKILKCAAGQVMPDSLYDNIIEGKPLTQVVEFVLERKERFPELYIWVSNFTEETKALMESLQFFHDLRLPTNEHGQFTAGFYQSVKDFAKNRELNTDFLENLCKGGQTCNV